MHGSMKYIWLNYFARCLILILVLAVLTIAILNGLNFYVPLCNRLHPLGFVISLALYGFSVVAIRLVFRKLKKFLGL